MRNHYFGQQLFSWLDGPFVATEHEYEPNQRLAEHLHARPYLCIVTRGGYRERTPRGTQDCPRSTLLLHPAGTRHSDEFFAARTRCLMIEIDAAWLDRAAGPKAFAAPLVTRAGALHAIGGRIEAELRIRDELTALAVHGLVLETVAAAARTERQAPAWLTRVVELIHDEPGGRHTLDGLARVAGVHPTHLARTFRARLGCSVGELVRRVRVAAAKEAIAGGMSLAETAVACGFADQSHFTRTFRRAIGTTPAAFRRALRPD
jgi:AraC family transcriptional regulator